ncbi:MAG: ABC-type transport auxiliary lipoprotein family protein [Bradymonadaceae bacterium]
MNGSPDVSTRLAGDSRSRASTASAVLLGLAWGLAIGGGGCSHGRSVTHYRPAIIDEAMKGAETPSREQTVVLGIETFSAAPAYDEQRMVYREKPFQLSYYHYHRWATAPGPLVSGFLADVYRRSGLFEAVVSGHDSTVDAVLSGSVLAMEEVDVEQGKWIGRVQVSLQLRDAMSGDLIWTRTIEQRVEMPEQTPAGLSRAISRGLTSIGASTAPDIYRAATRVIRKRSEPSDAAGTQDATDSDGTDGSSADVIGSEADSVGLFEITEFLAAGASKGQHAELIE